MLNRRELLAASTAMISLGGVAFTPSAQAAELPVPTALKNATDQFYNFLLDLIKAQGVGTSQRLVINSTIVPFDLSAETPYYNEELFRLHADRTFSSSVEPLLPSTAVSQATRFSSQYKTLLSIAASQIDQVQPKVEEKISKLQEKLKVATDAYNNKVIKIERDWAKVAKARALDLTTSDAKKINEINLQKAKWYADINFADQIRVFSDDISGINNQIDAVRRGAYSPTDQAILENISAIATGNNIARPWNAQVELSAKQTQPLTDLFLADPTHLPPALFDSSPLILPAGNLTNFLTNTGDRSFSTKTTSSTVETGSGNWSGGGSGGGSFLGISIGGGGGSSGSSTYSKAISTMNSVEASFKNIAEYFADRSAWFNPAVLQDPIVRKRLKGRREFDNLRYIAVSVILVRGLTLKLGFSEKVNSEDWSQRSIAAQGGISFFGWSVGGRGGSSSTSSVVKVDETGTSVTFQDGDNVCRILGVRIEPFIETTPTKAQTIDDLAKSNVELSNAFSDFTKGNKTYLDLQRAKIDAIK